MSLRFDFENLEVYKKSMDFINRIYKVTKEFPREEIFGLTSQFRRAALSIALNIAEGSGRLKKLEKRRFYEIARASVFECVPIIEVSKNQGYIEKEDCKKLRDICAELGRMITGLMKSISDRKSF
ncbi:MAG: four helix bundle protein [Deltaproteobacteria bacterium]|nr:four helix bundle protein [Deltaproteobacteria bacterium]